MLLLATLNFALLFPAALNAYRMLQLTSPKQTIFFQPWFILFRVTVLTITASVKVFLSSHELAGARALINFFCCLFITACTAWDYTCTSPVLNRAMGLSMALSASWSLGAVFVVDAKEGDLAAQVVYSFVELTILVPLLFACTAAGVVLVSLVVIAYRHRERVGTQSVVTGLPGARSNRGNSASLTPPTTMV